MNEAVERAHVDGVLTAASLMVAAPAAGDAIERARRLPRLAVGLHLTLLEAAPAAPGALIPALLGPTGLLRTDMVALSIEIAARADVRRQLAFEIAAQFDAFAATGLPCDHVNAHKHFHVHPVIAAMVMREARARGIDCLRAPCEPTVVLRAIEPRTRPAPVVDRLAADWLRLRLRRAGFRTPDHVFGLAWTGAMTSDRVAGLLRRLPEGTCEIYSHPATSAGWPGAAPGYRFADELAALLGSEARQAMADGEVASGGYRAMLV